MLSAGLVFAVTGALFASASIVSAQRDFVSSVFAGNSIVRSTASSSDMGADTTKKSSKVAKADRG